MSAPMEEAVFHEPRKDSEVGSVRREEGVLRQNETGMPRCKSRTGRVLGAGRARGPSQPGVVAVTFAAHPHHAKNQDKSHQESP